jgi:hypothetical protein
MEPTCGQLLDRVLACAAEGAKVTSFASRAVAGQCKHDSIRMEQSYINWMKRYTFFHNVRHPDKMGAAEVEAFLTHVAVNDNVAAYPDEWQASCGPGSSLTVTQPPTRRQRHRHRCPCG